MALRVHAVGAITPDAVSSLLGASATETPTAAAGYDHPHPLWASILIALLIGALIILIVFGNVLVILSVCLDRRLRKPPNILIINLAISDIAVAVLDMPFAAAFELRGVWVWSQTVCDFWISCDVMVCTASIMTLCMISVDRYMAITRPLSYVNRRTPRLMVVFILIVWITSAFIGLQPLIIWGGNEHEDNSCLLSQNPYFTIVSTFGAFYLPLTVMLLVYVQIYRAARKSELADLRLRHQTAMFVLSAQNAEGTRTCRSQSVDSTAAQSNTSSCDGNAASNTPPRSQERRSSVTRVAEFLITRTRFSSGSIQNGGPRRISLKRERKAAKTLGVIMGAFIFCWLPFFIVALVRPYCNCDIPPLLTSFLLWLGFTNSLLNPIIYPFFNKDFGPAYRSMLSCRCVHFRKTHTGGNSYRRQVTFRPVDVTATNECADDDDDDDDSSEDDPATRHAGLVHCAPRSEPGMLETELNGNVDNEADNV